MWKRKGEALVFGLLIAVSVQAQPGISPERLLSELGALPERVQGAECNTGAKLAAQAEKQLFEETVAAQQAAAVHVGGAVTDAQGAAIEKLGSEAVSQCQLAIAMKSGGLFTDVREQLDQTLTEIDSERYTRREACDRLAGEGGGDGEAESRCFRKADSEAEAKALGAVNRFLGQVKPVYDGFKGEVSRCVRLREAAVNEAREAGVKGMFWSMALSTRVGNWGLVSELAKTRDTLCSDAVQGTKRFDFQN